MPFQEGGHLFARWLAPVFESGNAAEHAAVSAGTEVALIVISVVVAVIGVALLLLHFVRRG